MTVRGAKHLRELAGMVRPGVGALAYQAEATEAGIALVRPLPVICPELPGCVGVGF